MVFHSLHNVSCHPHLTSLLARHITEQDIIIVINRHIWFSLHKYSLTAHSLQLLYRKTFQFTFYITVFSALEDLTIFKGETEHFVQLEEVYWTDYSLLASSEKTVAFTFFFVPQGTDLSGWSPWTALSSGFQWVQQCEEPAGGRWKEGWEVFLPIPSLLSRGWLVMPLYQNLFAGGHRTLPTGSITWSSL